MHGRPAFVSAHARLCYVLPYAKMALYHVFLHGRVPRIYRCRVRYLFCIRYSAWPRVVQFLSLQYSRGGGRGQPVHAEFTLLHGKILALVME